MKCVMFAMRMLELVPLVAALTLAGCVAGDVGGDEGVPDTGLDASTFELEIGRYDAAGRFVPMEQGAHAEIVVGFQGLIFVELAVRAPAHVDATLSGQAEVQFADAPSLDFSFPVSRLVLERQGLGRVGGLRVPFGQDLALIDEQRITLTVELSGGSWSAVSSAVLVIADRVRCSEHERRGTVEPCE